MNMVKIKKNKVKYDFVGALYCSSVRSELRKMPCQKREMKLIAT